jgi:hypothetical protein
MMRIASAARRPTTTTFCGSPAPIVAGPLGTSPPAGGGFPLPCQTVPVPVAPAGVSGGGAVPGIAGTIGAGGALDRIGVAAGDCISFSATGCDDADGGNGGGLNTKPDDGADVAGVKLDAANGKAAGPVAIVAPIRLSCLIGR